MVVNIAQSIGSAGGVIGCRMTGGGFGGCAVAIVRSEAVEEVGERLHAAYRRRFAVPLAIFSSRPSAGARNVGVESS